MKVDKILKINIRIFNNQDIFYIKYLIRILPSLEINKISTWT